MVPSHSENQPDLTFVSHNLRVSEKDTYKVSLAKSIVPVIVYVREELKVNASIYIPWCAMKNA